ncbi:MAG: FtsX-like permease family protein [Oscillospiraceae bacterium]
MRKFSFYPRLAAQNLGRNKQFYLPFILTCVATCAMFYIMFFLGRNSGLLDPNTFGGDTLAMIMQLGIVVIGIFSAVFLFYTNSFLMKRRNKELGLYSILGMGKRHIAKVLFFETLYVAIIGLVLGLGLGILLSKLTLLLLFKIVRVPVAFGFEISYSGIIGCLCLFAGIFFFILLSNFWRISRAKPIELLRGGAVGEKEPKTKWLLAILGVLSLGGGYYIALVTEEPIRAMALFFVAVMLVIFGTYCLFTAGIIALLKFLRSKPDYYYKTKHFIPVSGMIYRMKQNAVGLANICILATMVLVMVSGTVCLYLGTEDSVLSRFPHEVAIHIWGPEGKAPEILTTAAQKAVTDSGLEIKSEVAYTELPISCSRRGNDFSLMADDYYDASQTPTYLSFVTAGDYEKMSGEALELAANEVLGISDRSSHMDSFTIMGQEFKVTKWLSDFPGNGEARAMVADYYYFIVADDAVWDGINASQIAISGDRAQIPEYYYGMEFDGSSAEKIAAGTAVKDAVYSIELGDPADEANADTYRSANVEPRESERAYILGMNGGFLFLGLFLGLIFIMATVLIMYYKQLSEGYDDRERFEIMQKVGLSRPEIKKALRSQILVVFFLPLCMAVVHIGFAFKMIQKLLLVLNLTNVGLFALCTLGTVGVFAIIYGISYLLTAKVYYKIVS